MMEMPPWKHETAGVLLPPAHRSAPRQSAATMAGENEDPASPEPLNHAARARARQLLAASRSRVLERSTTVDAPQCSTATAEASPRSSNAANSPPKEEQHRRPPRHQHAYGTLDLEEPLWARRLAYLDRTIEDFNPWRGAIVPFGVSIENLWPWPTVHAPAVEEPATDVVHLRLAAVPRRSASTVDLRLSHRVQQRAVAPSRPKGGQYRIVQAPGHAQGLPQRSCSTSSKGIFSSFPMRT